MISNINYRGKIISDIDKLPFRCKKPIQFSKRFNDYSIIVFPNRHCRIMGCKKELNPNTLPFEIIDIQLQSITITLDLNMKINLFKLASLLSKEAMFEPELFPALRVLTYNPLCVNMFSSGKVVITGIRTFEYKHILSHIETYLLNLITTI